METNKELLNKVIEQNTELAQKHFELALQFSDFQNKQDNRFNKIENYLKSDKDTNQEGAIEKLNRLETLIQELKTNNKVMATTYGISGAGIMLVLKWIVSKVIL